MLLLDNSFVWLLHRRPSWSSKYKYMPVHLKMQMLLPWSLKDSCILLRIVQSPILRIRLPQILDMILLVSGIQIISALVDSKFSKGVPWRLRRNWDWMIEILLRERKRRSKSMSVPLKTAQNHSKLLGVWSNIWLSIQGSVTLTAESVEKHLNRNQSWIGTRSFIPRPSHSNAVSVRRDSVGAQTISTTFGVMRESNHSLADTATNHSRNDNISPSTLTSTWISDHLYATKKDVKHLHNTGTCGRIRRLIWRIGLLPAASAKLPLSKRLTSIPIILPNIEHLEVTFAESAIW